MKEFELIYLGHFHDLTGKAKEIREFDVLTVNDIIDKLDLLYQGMRKLLRKDDGTALPQNAIVLYRKGDRAKFIYDFSTYLTNGDCITFL